MDQSKRPIYTELEWNDMKSYFVEELEKEKAKLERAYGTVNNLTFHLCNKNKEIKKLEFYLEALTKGLSVAGDAIREMRNDRN